MIDFFFFNKKKDVSMLSEKMLKLQDVFLPFLPIPFICEMKLRGFNEIKLPY